MDSLLTSRRPIKNVKVLSKKVKCKKVLAPQRRSKPAAESVPERGENVPEHGVSFVSLYNDVCRERGGRAPAFFKRCEPRGLGEGDAQAPLAHLILEINY